MGLSLVMNNVDLLFSSLETVDFKSCILVLLLCIVRYKWLQCYI